MSTSRNFIAILILTVVYIAMTILFAPHNWIYQAVLPTFIAIVGFYLASGPVLVRSVVSGLTPFVSLPLLSIPFRDGQFGTIIGFAVIHAVLIGAFLGLLWGNVDAYLRGKRTPRIR